MTWTVMAMMEEGVLKINTVQVPGVGRRHQRAFGRKPHLAFVTGPGEHTLVLMVVL